jgi:hypothetical protein
MTIADDLVAAFQPWLTADLEAYLRAMGSMFEEVELYALDTDDGLYEGWERLFDPDLVPAPALPYLAMLVGERLSIGILEATMRQVIKDRPNQMRGTVPGLVAAAQKTLTGTGTVAIRERDGDEDHLTIHTLASETPNEAQVRADLLSVMPADIVLTYSIFVGATLGDEQAAYATLGAAQAAHGTLGEFSGTLVGYTIYTR